MRAFVSERARERWVRSCLEVCRAMGSVLEISEGRSGVRSWGFVADGTGGTCSYRSEILWVSDGAGWVGWWLGRWVDGV